MPTLGLTLRNWTASARDRWTCIEMLWRRIVPRSRSVFFEPTHPYTRALLSAVPTLEEKPFKAADCLLEGEPPSPIDLPPGCSFAARCPHAMPRCRVEEPPLVDLGGGRFSACWLNELPASRAA